MLTLKHQEGAAKFRGNIDSEDFNYSIVEAPIITSPSTSNIVISDANIARQTSTGIIPNYRILVNPSWLHTGFTFESKTPSIAAVDAVGNVTRLSNGVGIININTKIGVKQVIRDMTNVAGTYDSFSSWVTGTLAHHIENAIANMISGKSPAASTSSFYDPDGPLTNESADWQRPNPNRFTGTLDLSSFSIGYWCNAILISPRHVIYSHLNGNPTIKFRAPDGTYHTRTVTELPFQSNGVGGSGDVDDNWVGILNADIPISGVGAIQPAKFLPSNFGTKMKKATINGYVNDTTPATRLAVLRKKQAGGAKVEILDAILRTTTQPLSLDLKRSVRVGFKDWSSDLIGGDSNGQVFVPIDEAGGTNYKAVLLSSINTGGGGRNFCTQLTEIQTIMNTLSTAAGLNPANYVLGQVSLATFPNVV